MRSWKRALVWAGAAATALLIALGFRGKALAEAEYGDTFRLLSDLPEDPDLREGERLATIYGCASCHGSGYSGRVFIDAPPFLVVAPNLTAGRGGVASEYRGVADWDRAIRYRIAPDGRGLLPMMPSENYHRMSDRDVALVIAYLAGLPPVDRELPETEIRLPGLPIAGVGVLHPPRDQPDAPGGPTPPRGPDAAYGAYLASIACAECHGDDLGGGPTPGGGPKAPALAPAGRWSFEAFARAMRAGLAPGDRPLAEEMPYAYLRYMTDTELEAIQAHLASLPVAEEAPRGTAAPADAESGLASLSGPGRSSGGNRVRP